MDRLLLGIGHSMIPIPGVLWRRLVRVNARKVAASIRFMSEEHHRVRDFVVRELPRAGGPLTPETIADAVGLDVTRVRSLLDELERRLTFLFRNADGAVTWAYPVTVDETPHRAHFATGEDAYSPWAIDTFAMPFVQGHLRQEPVTITFETECAHCARPLQLEMDEEIHCRVGEGAAPLAFLPLVDFARWKDPSIIDGFWRRSVFFWSEEHAREHRRWVGGGRGLYVTASQAAVITRLVQGAVFALPRSPAG